jgi:hypothetical protein
MPVLPRRPSALAAPLAVALAALVLPTAAVASPEGLIRDCQDGTISGTYSARDYTDALRDIPTDVDEYTDCRDVIRRAQLGAAGGSRSGTGSSGAGGASGSAGTSAGGGAGGGGGTGRAPTAARVLATASPQERAAVREAIASGGGAAPLEVGGERIDPAAIARGAGTSSSSLPGAVLVALVLLGVTALAGSAHALRTRVLGSRPAR